MTQKKVLDYVALKQSAKQKRVDRLLWLDTKIREYQLEKVEVQKSITRDSKAVDTLSELAQEAQDLEGKIDEYARQTFELTGLAAESSHKMMLQSQERLEEVREAMRATYYDR